MPKQIAYNLKPTKDCEGETIKMNFKKINKIYNLSKEENPKNNWLITQLGGGFSLYCSIFHKKYHEYKDDGKFYRKHRCVKCEVVYLSPEYNEDYGQNI